MLITLTKGDSNLINNCSNTWNFSLIWIDLLRVDRAKSEKSV